MSMSSSIVGEEEEGRKKRRHPSSASATAAASGTSAQVTGESIFEILAARKALKCPCEADIVNSASATTGKKMRHSEDLCQSFVENPRYASEWRYQSPRYQRFLMKRRQQQQGGITRSWPKKSGIMAPEDLPTEILPNHPFYCYVAAGVEVMIIEGCYATKPVKNPFDP